MRYFVFMYPESHSKPPFTSCGSEEHSKHSIMKSRVVTDDCPGEYARASWLRSPCREKLKSNPPKRHRITPSPPHGSVYHQGIMTVIQCLLKTYFWLGCMHQQTIVVRREMDIHKASRQMHTDTLLHPGAAWIKNEIQGVFGGSVLRRPRRVTAIPDHRPAFLVANTPSF